MKRAIYGAGQFGRYFFEVLDKKVGVDFFIDAYSPAKTIAEKRIIKPNNLSENAIIYNSVLFHDKKIVMQMRNMGYEVKSFVDTLREFPEILNIVEKERYLWFENRQELNIGKLKEVEYLLSDGRSRQLLKKIIEFRKTLDMTYYPKPTSNLSEQYFPKDVPIIPEDDELRFIDCGAFTGDTLELIRNNVSKEKKISVVSFEPDPNNLKKFQENVKNFSNIRTVLVPMGVYSKTTILSFSLSGCSSGIDENGEMSIPVTTLDETVYSFHPNYIKMDVEGAEKEALLGAQNIIKEFTPNLAISLYHKAEDLWELPLLVNELNPNYDFYIRTHAHLGVETVLYCVRKRQ